MLPIIGPWRRSYYSAEPVVDELPVPVEVLEPPVDCDEFEPDVPPVVPLVEPFEPVPFVLLESLPVEPSVPVEPVSVPLEVLPSVDVEPSVLDPLEPLLVSVEDPEPLEVDESVEFEVDESDSLSLESVESNVPSVELLPLPCSGAAGRLSECVDGVVVCVTKSRTTVSVPLPWVMSMTMPAVTATASKPETSVTITAVRLVLRGRCLRNSLTEYMRSFAGWELMERGRRALS